MELYNLTADPLETRDVAHQHTDVAGSIKAMLSAQGLSCVCYQC